MVSANIGNIIGDSLEAPFKHLPDFAERRLFCHIAAVYHAAGYLPQHDT
jgi:hypothetical protein